MALIQNRALLFNIGVFVANNNIRRSQAAFTHNYATADGSVNNVIKTLQPSGTWTFTPNSNSVVLLIETTSPVEATVSLATITAPVRSGTSYLTLIKQVLLIDDAVTSVMFTNFGTTPLQLTIFQG